ncbi:MAG: ribosome maturation factor RimP [Eubacteriales bacterium]|nr:ribosome maturation factor RimP [Eubacteriales bacterium]
MAKKRAGGEEAAGLIGEKIANNFGYDLVGVTMDKEPAGVYLRFFLDKPEGISLSDCERFHREVQPQLDALDYDFLEVCSPGLDRPIKTDRDAKRALGEMVELRLYKTCDGRKAYTGIFRGLSDAGYLIETDAGEILFPRKDVAVVRRVVDMSILEDETITEQEVGYEQP